MCCRIPLAVSQQSISHKSQVQSSSSRLLPQHGQAHLRHNGHCQDQAQGKDRRLSSHVPALGGRAVTELDFSRHRPVNNSGIMVGPKKSINHIFGILLQM